MKTNDQLIAEQLRSNSEFCAEWERTVGMCGGGRDRPLSGRARSLAAGARRARAHEATLGRAPRVGRGQPEHRHAHADLRGARHRAHDRRAAGGCSGSECHEASAGQQCCRLGSDRPGGTRRPRSLGIALLIHTFFCRSADLRPRRDRLVLAAPELPANAEEVIRATSSLSTSMRGSGEYEGGRVDAARYLLRCQRGTFGRVGGSSA